MGRPFDSLRSLRAGQANLVSIHISTEAATQKAA